MITAAATAASAKKVLLNFMGKNWARSRCLSRGFWRLIRSVRLEEPELILDLRQNLDQWLGHCCFSPLSASSLPRSSAATRSASPARCSAAVALVAAVLASFSSSRALLSASMKR